MNNQYNYKSFYTGNIEDGDSFRNTYLQSIENYIETKMQESYDKRSEFMPPLTYFEHIEDFRKKFLKMIGQPVDSYPNYIPKVESIYVGKDDFCEISRLSIEVMDNFYFYGILMVPHKIDDKAPLVIAQHGGGGSPELCSDMVGENAYDHFTKRALERKMVVFSPQLLLWNFDIDVGEKFPVAGVKFDKGKIDKRLKQLGLSVSGLEIYCIRRSIDYLLSLDFIDGNKVGMMGLSYGGFYSLYTAAVDKRIKAVYSGAAFNDKCKICFYDWSYKGSAIQFNDAEVAALVCPRLLITDVGKQDPVFDYKFSINEAERVKRYYKAAGYDDKYIYNLWDGAHKFDISSGNFDRFFDELEK